MTVDTVVLNYSYSEVWPYVLYNGLVRVTFVIKIDADQTSLHYIGYIASGGFSHKLFVKIIACHSFLSKK